MLCKAIHIVCQNKCCQQKGKCISSQSACTVTLKEKLLAVSDTFCLNIIISAQRFRKDCIDVNKLNYLNFNKGFLRQRYLPVCGEP